jgi:hypothetical protein
MSPRGDRRRPDALRVPREPRQGRPRADPPRGLLGRRQQLRRGRRVARGGGQQRQVAVDRADVGDVGGDDVAPGVGREQPPQLGRAGRVAQVRAHLGQQRQRWQPQVVARQRGEAGGGEALVLAPQVVLAAGL